MKFVEPRPFDDPIPLPSGGELVTLRDAADYITELPKREHDAQAIEALMLIVEKGGPTMMARIGVLQALNRNVERVLTNRKEHRWGKRKLARDR
jgi:hypothetical protein